MGQKVSGCVNVEELRSQRDWPRICREVRFWCAAFSERGDSESVHYVLDFSLIAFASRIEHYFVPHGFDISWEKNVLTSLNPSPNLTALSAGLIFKDESLVTTELKEEARQILEASRDPGFTFTEYHSSLLKGSASI